MHPEDTHPEPGRSADTVANHPLWALSHDLLGITDDRGLLLYANPEWEGVLGGVKEAGSLRDLVHPEDRTLIPAQTEVVREGTMPAEGTVRFRDRTGTYRPMAFRFHRADGRFFMAMRDLSEQTGFRKALTHSHDLMQYIIEHSQSAVAVHDRDLRYLYVSRKYLEDYRVQEQEVLGRHHYDVFPDLPEKWREVHRRCLAGEVLSAEDDPFPRADGTVDWTRWECRPWYDRDGTVGGIIIYTEVINRWKAIEQELRTSRDYYESIFHRSPIGIAMVDRATGIYRDVNDTMAEMLGYPVDQLKKMRWTDLSHPGDIGPTREQLRRLRQDGVPVVSLDKRMVRADAGCIWVNVTITHLTSDRETPDVLAMYMDITERRERERQILQISRHDELTGLYNRTYFDRLYQKHAGDGRFPMAIVMLDLDGLKLINDREGHENGDRLLVMAAEALRSQCTGNTAAARVGGDEFAVLLPDTDDAGAQDWMIRIARVFREREPDPERLSVSMGYALFRTAEDRMYNVFRVAEDRMLRSKLSSRTSMRSSTIELVMNSLHEKNERELWHSRRVSEISAAIGSAMNLGHVAVEELALAGLVHDIGKIGIPDSVLDKPGRLTSSEWDLIRQHSEKGYRLLSSMREFSQLARCILQHHERFDGTGYPQGLSGEHILLESRILALADAYDAMTSDRAYRAAMSREAALAEVRNNSGTQFDPDVVRAFEQFMSAVPAASDGTVI